MPYAPKPKAKPAKIKVSQSTIDKIKTMGMTAALKKAGSSKNAEYIEGIRRMYGASRLAKAQSAAKPVSRTADQARARNAAKTKPVVNKTADQARSRAMSSTKTSTKASAPKSKNIASFKPGTIGYKVAKAFKNTGKTTTSKPVNYGNRGM